MSNVVGTSGADTLVGTAQADSIQGHEGNDDLIGSAGNDTIDGGAGSDDLYDGSGDDVVDGGAGSDSIHSRSSDQTHPGSGSDTLRGGEGADWIYVDRNSTVDTLVQIDTGSADAASPGSMNNVFYSGGIKDSVVVAGGDDRDYVSLRGSLKAATVDLGAGDDTVHIETYADYRYDPVTSQPISTIPQVSITTGGGRDTIGLTSSTYAATIEVIDFTAGTGGDVLKLDSFLNARLQGWDGGSNPFALGYLRLVQAGADVVLELDTDAAGANAGWTTLVTFRNTLVASFTADNFEPRFAPDGSEPAGQTTTGTSGDDFLNGALGDDTVDGGSGDDRLDGGTGYDSLIGGDGDDHLQGGAGNDILDGGNNGPFVDQAVYSDSPTGVSVDLAAGTASDGWGGIDTLINIEGVTGSQFADTLRGDAGHNWFTGGTGDDTIDGRDGYDRVFYGYVPTGVDIDLTLGTATAQDGSETDLLIGIEAVHGSEFGDRIVLSDRGGDSATGHGGDDTITGGSGDDFLIGGAGNDVMNGSGGRNRVSYLFDVGSQGVHVDLSLGEATDNWGGRDTLTNIQDVQGSTMNDTLIGSDQDNNLQGEDGDDSLEGGNGDDALEGGAGADTLDGGEGFDMVGYWGASSGITVDLAIQSNNSGDANGDILSNIEHISGTSFDDALFGDSGGNGFAGDDGNDLLSGRDGDDYLTGGAGRDTLDGGEGADTYGTDGSQGGTSGIYVNLTVGTAIDGHGDVDTLVSIENVDGGALDDVIVGNASDNQLQGWEGDDTLKGEDGHDNIAGGDGNDSLSGGAGWDRLTGGAGNDTIDGGAGEEDRDDVVYQDHTSAVHVDLTGGWATDEQGDTDTLSNIENVLGSQFDDILVGNAGDNWFTGGAGNDTIDGRDGQDVVFYGESSVGFVIDLKAGTAVARDNSQADTLINIEAVNASQGDDTVILSDAGGHVFGHAGDDDLRGGAEGAYFNGGTGNDTITGGGGFNNTVSYFEEEWEAPAPTHGVFVNLADQTATDNWGGQDTLTNIRSVRGSMLNDTLTGDDQDNSLQGEAGNDVLDGSAGRDWLEGGDGDDTLQGGIGNDGLNGGEGNDLLIGGTNIDAATYDDDYFEGSTGNDTIYGGEVGVSDDPNLNWNDLNYRRLGSTGVRVEFGPLARSGTVEKLGGLGTDTFFSIDAVRGTDGADTFIGGSAAGNQRFVGYAGNDVFDGTFGINEVDYRTEARAVGLTTGLVINLASGQVQDATGATDTLIAIERVRGTENADHITGNELDNRLRGDSGNDTLRGGVGNDTLDGGAGWDTLQGGEGNDVLIGGVGAEGDEDYFIGSTGNDTIYGGDATGDDHPFLNWNMLDYRHGSFSSIRVEFGSTGRAGTVQKSGGVDGTDSFFSINAVGGTDGADTFIGGMGADNQRFIGFGGNDTFDGTLGVNEVDYRYEAQALGLTTAGLVIDLNAGQVTDITGATDTLIAIERVRGTEGGDRITGNELDNRLRGYGGNDTLDGGAGSDQLEGGAGNDTFASISSGHGADLLIGGEGQDTYVLSSDAGIAGTSHSADTITDFQAGLGGDRIDLTDALLAVSNFVNGRNPFATGHLRLEQQGDDVILQIDRDAGGTGQTWVDLLVLQSVLVDALTVDNFVPPYDPSVPLDVNTPPLVSDELDGGSHLEDGAPVSLDLLSHASDVDAGTVLVIKDGEAGITATVLNGPWTDALQFKLAGGILTFDPTQFNSLAEGETVEFVLNYVVIDGAGGETPAGARLTVTGSNDLPVITGGDVSRQYVEPDTATGVHALEGVITFKDPDLFEVHSVDVVGSEGDQTGLAFGADIITGPGPNGPGEIGWTLDVDSNVLESLAAGDVRTLIYTLRLSDLSGATVDEVVTVTITGTNDAPVVKAAVDGGGHVEDDAPFSIDLLAQASDIDHGAVLAIKNGGTGVQVTTAGAAWTAALQFALVDGTLTIDPAQFNGLGAGEVLEFTLAYTVTDGQGGETPATAHFVITGADDALAGFSLSGSQVTENAAGGTVVASLLGLDPDRTTSFSYSLVEDASGLFEITGDELRVKAGAVLDYETAASHTLRIAVSNGTEQVIETVTITVGNVAGAVIVGSDRADVVNATSGLPGQALPGAEDDRLDGRGGNDALAGLGGNDQILGGAGNDTLDGGSGSDTLDGGTGADSLTGGAGDDTLVVAGTEALGDVLDGGEGRDTLRVTGTGALSLSSFSATAAAIEVWAGNGEGLTGTIGADTLDLSGLVSATGLPYVDGGAGHDVLTGTSWADDLRGSAGNDQLVGGAGDDQLHGGSGADTLLGGAGNDRFQITSTEATGDSLNGGEGEDTLEVIGAAATVLGTFDALAASIEHLTGNGRALVGTGGNDVLDFSGLKSLERVLYVDASTGNDRLVGQAGADDLRGGSGADTLSGGRGADSLDGGYGDDNLDGGADADVLKGGVGNDRLVGGLGTDTLSGGTGHDTFVFTGLADGGDLISDFMQGADRIALVGAEFGLSAGTLAAGRFALGAAAAAQGQFLYEQASSTLLWDADGTGSGAGVTIARFRPGQILKADDLSIL